MLGHDRVFARALPWSRIEVAEDRDAKHMRARYSYWKPGSDRVPAGVQVRSFASLR